VISLHSAACRILVVDDYEPWRRFVSSTLQEYPSVRVVGEATDGLEAIQRAAELNPYLALLDIHLPKLDGIKVADRLSHASPGTKILFTSQSNDPDLISAALSNGACGYVLKADAATDLLPAIEAALRGERFVSRGVRQPASQ